MNKGSVGSRVSTVSFKRETSVIIDQIPDVSRGKVFPTLLLFMEAIYMFAISSMSVYSLYGFGEFIIAYNDREVLAMTTAAKFYGCCVVLIFGILCDSYLGHYYSALTMLFINICLPTIYFIIAVCPYVYGSNAKLILADASNPFWALLICSEPLRISVIATAVLEQFYFRKPRTFFAALVYVWYLGAALGGLTVWWCGYSRVGYAIILGVDIILMSLYAGFWLFSKSTLLIDKGPWAIVERALAYTLCCVCRKIDKWFLRKCLFKKKHEPNDFRCVQFSDRSATNSRSLMGILLVTLPLTAYFCMLVILETLYYVQISMLYYEKQLFPLLAIKAGCYLLIFPPVEFIASKYLGKWFRSSITKQLTLLGIGAFIVSFAVMWSSVVQHEIVKDLDFWRHLKGSLTHVAITNCLDTPVKIRGKYYNQIIAMGMDEWATLEPLRPLFILRIPMAHVPFHMEFENYNLSLYDEYTLPLVVGTNNWYVLFPEGLRQVHPSCYTTYGQMAVNPRMFEPATVCVMCALAVCNGHLIFQGSGINERYDVALGTKMEDSKIRLSGKYQVSVRFGEVGVSGDPEEINFEKLGSYLMVVYEKRFKRSSKKKKSAVSYERNSAIHVLETFPPRKKTAWWMLPTVILHAVGQVFAEVSLLTYLYIVSPVDVRTTVFSLTRFLCLPAYWYLFKKNCLSLQDWMPLYFFTLGCANCLFMIIYFFSTVYYIHRFLAKRPQTRQRRSLQVGSDTAIRTGEDEMPHGIKES